MSARLRIDPTRCRGHAICVLFFSEGMDLDRWGYGRVIESELTDRRDVKRAQRAAAACPNGAVVVTMEGDGLDDPPVGVAPLKRRIERRLRL